VPRSRRPLHSPKRTPAAVEDEIIEIRKQLSHAGHEAGAATIAAHLERRHGASPAISTIWRILTERDGAKLHHIGIGRRHKGRHVLVLVKDRHVRITTTDGELLRDFQLDPSRDYQPQPKT